MRHSFKGSSTVGSFCLLVLSACGAVEESGRGNEIGEVQSAFTYVPPPTTDSLTTYAAKCDAATGIHVPPFSCMEGLEGPDDPHFAFVPVTSGADNVENEWQVGITGGVRTPPAPPATTQSIVAGGAGIGDESDELFFASVDFSLAGRAEVLVTSLTGATAQARAGLMLRAADAPDPGAANALLAVTRTGGVVFQHRAETDGDTVNTTPELTGQAFPLWLRLTWTGIGVTAQISSNHETWTQVGETADIMVDADIDIQNFKVGLATGAGTAGFDQFLTDKKCDRPSVLQGVCDPGSTFQVLERTADAIAVANCRKGGEIEDDRFSDVAVIQYNRKNGALCFYQSPTPPGGFSAGDVSAPSEGNGDGKFAWEEPAATHAVGCTSCHDSGALIRSPYLMQTGLLPGLYTGYTNDGSNPWRPVGLDFAEDRSWFVSAPVHWTDPDGAACNACHHLAVSNVTNSVTFDGQGGTAYRFSMMATSEDQVFLSTDEQEALPWRSRKNEHSETSPSWMRPGQVTFDAGAHATAGNFSLCAKGFWDAGFETTTDLQMAGCQFSPFGEAYEPPIQNINEFNVATSGGSATGNLTFLTLTAPAHTEVFDTTDEFFYAYAIQGGDGTAVVKVTDLPDTNAYAKAGLMYRDGYGTGAVNAMIAVTRDHGAVFQYRATDNATTEDTYLDHDAGTPDLPIWLKMERSGRTFVGSVSTDDGNSWQQVGEPVTLIELETDFVGLVATSHEDSNASAEADFESFDWTAQTGWTKWPDPHVLVNASIGGAETTRKEWITQETITSSGGDITGDSDTFSYAFKTFGGDGHLETTVTSLKGAGGGAPHRFAKAGLMFRETAAANSPYVFVGRIRDGITFQYRSGANNNATTTWNDESVGDDPISFRLRRVEEGGDDIFTAAYKIGDGAWQLVPTSAVITDFLVSPLAGLAVSSWGESLIAEATFDSGEYIEPPGLIWTSYDQPENNDWREDDIAQSLLTPVSQMSFGAPGSQTITAAGGQIFGNADQFFYAFQDLPGAATIQAKVNVLGDATTSASAKVGLMFRNSASPGAPNVMMAVTRGQGAGFQYRSTEGGTTTFPGFVSGAAPLWLKLVRTAGNKFTGYKSSNGTTWTQVGTATVTTIQELAQVGLAVTSRDPSKPVTVEFSNVSVTLQQSHLNPCATLCANPTTFTFNNNYQSGNLGTGAICRETTKDVAGGNCGNFVSGRKLYVNGVQKTCNNQNWSSVPAPVGGGYCVQATAGNHSYAYFTVFE